MSFPFPTQVKKFLKASGGIDLYEDVKVTWKKGYSPKLYIQHDDGTAESIPLSTINDQDKLHALMVKKGFRRKSG